ncbi:MAG: glycosyltransferase family 4 protein [Luteolibacter sp.]|uniref:glycosyltransferase family 4 protein n=1 Tax=Luteolibacter sp. TaxID=1962973 RepID=UPI003265F80E
MSTRVFTCTPVAFGGGPDFFARDSGLMCRGLREIGCESRAVMPGARQDDDEPDLIRTEFANLESAAWWNAHQLDAVILYAWGSPRFRKVAAAIRQAGIFLILNQDNGGLISPLAGFRGWLAEQRILSGSGDLAGFVKRVARGLTTGLLVTDPMRAAHLRQGDVIACVSPVAAGHYRKLCRAYGGDRLARRVEVLPHPVQSIFRTDAVPKSRQVACVGRWQERIQKRPELMQSVIGEIIRLDHEVRVEIVGTDTPELEMWRRSLDAAHRERVHLRGRVGRNELARILRESQIFYSPSAFESFGIAAGEALCSGCSVVAGRSPSMASFEWFTSDGSGQLAETDDAAQHLTALQNELSKWESGLRNPELISKTWTSRLHADKVAERALELRANRLKTP